MKPLDSAYLNVEDEGNEVSEGKERSGLEGRNEGEGGGTECLGNPASLEEGVEERYACYPLRARSVVVSMCECVCV